MGWTKACYRDLQNISRDFNIEENIKSGGNIFEQRKIIVFKYSRGSLEPDDSSDSMWLQNR